MNRSLSESLDLDFIAFRTAAETIDSKNSPHKGSAHNVSDNFIVESLVSNITVKVFACRKIFSRWHYLWPHVTDNVQVLFHIGFLKIFNVEAFPVHCMLDVQRIFNIFAYCYQNCLQLFLFKTDDFQRSLHWKRIFLNISCPISKWSNFMPIAFSCTRIFRTPRYMFKNFIY